MQEGYPGRSRLWMGVYIPGEVSKQLKIKILSGRGHCNGKHLGFGCLYPILPPKLSLKTQGTLTGMSK